MTTWYGDDEEPLGVISAYQSQTQNVPTRHEEPDPSGAQQYTDSTGAVTVWTDDDLRIVHLQISNRWRERTRKTSLERALLEAFRSRELELSTRMEPLGPMAEDVRPFDPRAMLRSDYYDIDAYARVVSDMLDVLERADDLDKRDLSSQSRFDPARGENQNHKVACVLDAQRLVSDITLDPTWLTDVRTERLTAAIAEALEAAYAHWREPEELVDPELLALRRDLDDVTQRCFDLIGLRFRPEWRTR